MKRIAASAALVGLLVSTVAYGQLDRTRGVGGGSPSVTRQSQKLTLIPADQWITSSYNFETLPNTTAGNGLFQQQSTASGVTLACAPPYLDLTATTNNRRCLVWERSAPADNASIAVPYGTGDDLTVQFHVVNLDLLVAQATGFFQFQYGDTTSYLVTKKPGGNSSFGIIVSGSGNAAAASVPANRVTCYTVAYSGGAADTNYVSSIAVPNAMKVTMHLRSDGNVDFFVNDALLSSIPTQWQGAEPTTQSWAFWINGAASSVAVAIGPITVQRNWP